MSAQQAALERQEHLNVERREAELELRRNMEADRREHELQVLQLQKFSAFIIISIIMIAFY